MNNNWNKISPTIAGIVVFIVLTLIVFAVNSIVDSIVDRNRYSSYKRGGSSYSYSSSYTSTSLKDSIPTCPPKNNHKAMTKEEANRLLGTGYHGCRPNSSAEIAELAAAQVTCKNCGYYSDNGRNSLCDYCSWMERYGGGLPGKATTSPTPTSTPKRSSTTTTANKDDPYNAGDYSDPDDFYFDHYDDFWDFEDAEDYWEDYQ